MPDPLHVIERAKSRPHSVDPKNPHLDLEFVVWRTNDDATVRAAMVGLYPITADSDGPLPARFYGLALLGYDPEPQGGGVWYVKARYGVKEGVQVPPVGDGLTHPPPPTPAETDPLGNEVSFTTSGGTRKLYQYLNTGAGGDAVVAVKAGGGAAPDYKGAINPTKDGVDGIEVIDPKLEFTLTIRPPSITLKYVNDLMNLTGSINNATWMRQNAQEWLFLGADGSYREKEGFTVVCKFAMSPQVVNFVVSSDITIPLKHGWDYVSVVYEDGTSNGRKVQTPLAAYTGRVYPLGDFTKLGIGGA